MITKKEIIEAYDEGWISKEDASVLLEEARPASLEERIRDELIAYGMEPKEANDLTSWIISTVQKDCFPTNRLGSGPSWV